MKIMLRRIQRRLDALEPGPVRDQLRADIACLKVRLMALPARVAAHAPFPDAAEMRIVLDCEVRDAFSDVQKWM
jgi:hypothetical protein